MCFSICYKCGSPKKGLLTPCPQCKEIPISDDDPAISLILSTHIKSTAELLEYSVVTFPMNEVATVTGAKEDNEVEALRKEVAELKEKLEEKTELETLDNIDYDQDDIEQAVDDANESNEEVHLVENINNLLKAIKGEN